MLADHQSFLRKFIHDPHGTGAVAAATPTLSNSVALTAYKAFARHRRSRDLRVLELGAGTGALTQRLARLEPVLVEKDASWAALLRLRFPGLEVRQECAVESLRSLAGPTGVVTSIPLLNNPQSAALKAALQARYAEGLLKFCVLYTYGWSDPLAGTGFRAARRASFVPRSLPPAHVWVYE
jgi:phospholipid N-methyltransferase